MEEMDGVNESDFWIQMRRNKPLGESRKTGQTPGTKMTFYSNNNNNNVLSAQSDVFYVQTCNYLYLGTSNRCNAPFPRKIRL
ncbi:hypothetical protein Hanom_Chr07g00663341 [Helianthus anomalus]